MNRGESNCRGELRLKRLLCHREGQLSLLVLVLAIYIPFEAPTLCMVVPALLSIPRLLAKLLSKDPWPNAWPSQEKSRPTTCRDGRGEATRSATCGRWTVAMASRRIGRPHVWIYPGMVQPRDAALRRDPSAATSNLESGPLLEGEASLISVAISSNSEIMNIEMGQG